MHAAEIFKFLLFVSGDTPNSALALANVKAMCASQQAGLCEFEVIDVFKDPERALAESIFMTPTLIKLQPRPVRRVVGTLSDAPAVMSALGLQI